MDNKNNKWTFGCSALFCLSFAMLIFGFQFAMPGAVNIEDGTRAGLNQETDWNGQVCFVLKDSDGNLKDSGCNHNLLTTQGQNFSIEALTGEDASNAAQGDDAKYISLSANDSAASAAWLVLPNEITTGGLERHEGTCNINAAGNVSCWYTFTATATHTAVHLAGLNWNDTDGTNSLVAAAALSSDPNLESGDTLTLNYTLSVS